MMSVENLSQLPRVSVTRRMKKGGWRNVPADMSSKFGGGLEKLGEVGDDLSFHDLLVLICLLGSNFRI
jgi:hypothetical protein